VTDAPRAVYVYGVMRASELDAVSAPGVEEADVRAVRHGELAALTSELRSDALSAAREVRAHWRVLEEVSKTATVLPARFGTVMESEQAVAEDLLEPNAERLAELLRQLAGRVQLSVKGHYDEPRLMREIVADSPAVAALRDKLRKLPEAAGYYDRIRLGELVAAAVEQRRAADTELALATLAPLAVDSREEEAAHAHAAFNLAFLVDRGREAEFTDAVDGLAAVLGDRVAIRYVGPLPPYSFAQADLTPRSEAWA
jgi:Gas vesicle synthesis protein GvpL/GvpF